jgi:hypothetical protein
VQAVHFLADCQPVLAFVERDVFVAQVPEFRNRPLKFRCQIDRHPINFFK